MVARDLPSSVAPIVDTVLSNSLDTDTAPRLMTPFWLAVTGTYGTHLTRLSGQLLAVKGMGISDDVRIVQAVRLDRRDEDRQSGLNICGGKYLLMHGGVVLDSP